MKALKTRLALSVTAIVAFSAVPAAAAGVEEAVVPPSNSAATQYTETFPTSGGDKKTDQKPGQSSPSKVLGSHNAHKLQEQGPEGRAAAEAAAATAPSTVEPATTTTTPTPSNSARGHSKGKGSSNSGAHEKHAKQPASGAKHATEETAAASPSADLPAGSSGAGSAIEQATGLSTSGQSGMLLPLVILATVICSLAYLWRQRQEVE